MERLTLTQAARALGVPQHRLIYLCEKGVVVPEIDDARGRGSSRKFSRRNLFEFSTALELRRLEIPLGIIRAILHAVRSFEAATRRTLPEFTVPDSLVGKRPIDVSVIVVDGLTLYFSISSKGSVPSIVGGVALPKGHKRTLLQPNAPRRLSKDDARKVLRSAKVTTEVNLTRIAQGLAFEET